MPTRSGHSGRPWRAARRRPGDRAPPALAPAARCSACRSCAAAHNPSASHSCPWPLDNCAPRPRSAPAATAAFRRSATPAPRAAQTVRRAPPQAARARTPGAARCSSRTTHRARRSPSCTGQRRRPYCATRTSGQTTGRRTCAFQGWQGRRHARVSHCPRQTARAGRVRSAGRPLAPALARGAAS